MRGPVELARSLVELGKMKRPKRPDPRQNTPGPAQLQIGAPDIGPRAHETDPAGQHGNGAEPGLARLFGKGGFMAWRGGEEDLERVRVAQCRITASPGQPDRAGDARRQRS